jgi:hypothetical protein
MVGLTYFLNQLIISIYDITTGAYEASKQSPAMERLLPLYSK